MLSTLGFMGLSGAIVFCVVYYLAEKGEI